MQSLFPVRVAAVWLLALAAFPSHAAEGDIRVLSRAETLRGPKEVMLDVRVAMPPGRSTADALLIVNSSSGRDDVVMANLAAAANGAGIAAVLLDTYTARGISDTITNQDKVSYVEQFGDILAVLQVMRQDPRFAGRKIAVSGHSRGAILAYMMAFRDFEAFYEAPVPLFRAGLLLRAARTHRPADEGSGFREGRGRNAARSVAALRRHVRHQRPWRERGG